MAIGKRIKYIRNLRGLTQKELGEALGFTGRTTDVRVAQYESESRIPKEELLADIADILKVNPSTLNVPDIDTYNGIMQTFFAMEDMYGLKVKNVDGEPHLYFDRNNPCYQSLCQMLSHWLTQSENFENDEISKEDYDNYRYLYPDSEAKRKRKLLRERRKKQNEISDK